MAISIEKYNSIITRNTPALIHKSYCNKSSSNYWQKKKNPEVYLNAIMLIEN
jgi:hypothetical protein